jgi:hypothetical protein
MDGADELTDDPVLRTRVLSPSDPDNMRLAFSMLIDRIVVQAADSIIDWGTAEFASQRAISLKTGQEFHYFHMAVRAVDVK